MNARRAIVSVQVLADSYHSRMGVRFRAITARAFTGSLAIGEMPD